MMKKYTVKEIAILSGISITTIYRYMKKHEELRRCLADKNEKGQVLFDQAAFDFVMKFKNDNQTIGTDNQTIIDDNQHENHASNSDTLKMLKGIIENQQETINSLVNNQASERQRADTIIMNMSNQIKTQVMLLEDLRKDIDQVKQQKVEEQTKPIVKEAPIPVQRKTEKKTAQAKKTFGTLYRMFLETFQPWKLREESREEKEAA